MKTSLPTDSKERKRIPLYSGFVRYFPAAIVGAAKVSELGRTQHGLSKLGHDRSRSSDHPDCVLRHMMDAADAIAAFDRNERSDSSTTELRDRVLMEASQAVWRVCAWSQELHERFGGVPMAPAAYISAPPPPPSSEELLDVPNFLRRET